MLKALFRARPVVLVPVIFVSLIMVGGFLAWIKSDHSRSFFVGTQQAEPSFETSANNQLSPTGDNLSSSSEQEDRLALDKSSRDEANQIAANLVRENLDKYGRESQELSLLVSEISKSFESLLSDDSGKRLANSENLVDKYMLHRQEFDSVRERLSEIEQSPQWLEAEFLRTKSESRPDYQLVNQKVTEKQSQLAELLTKCKSLQNSLARIVSDSSSDATGDKTLQDILDQRLVLAEDKRLQQLKQKEKELEEKHVKELEELASQKLQAEHEAEKQRQLDQIAQMNEQTEAEKTKAEIARKKRQLEAEFEGDWPQIQHYLGVLFKHSSRQIVGGNVVGVEEEGPVSLAGLRSLGKGALGNDYEKKLSGLLLFFSYDEAGGRGVGPYPVRYLGSAITRDQEAAIRPAYLLLEKYGELLVEKKLLAP